LATLLTAITYDFRALLLRHILVGIGEATFVTITPSFLADLFDEEQRGRIFAFFYLATPVGTALGYVIGGQLGPHYGWRAPFYVAGAPGFLLGLCMLAIPEPERGKYDSISETTERGTIAGLFHNWAFWTATLGMAFVTFALGGLLVWMPTFLSRLRGYHLEQANQIFGLSVLFNGVVATLIGGWLADRLLRRLAGAYYLTSAIGLALALPVMVLALRTTGPMLLPAIVASGFLLLLNTGPLNAAVITSVGAHIRSTAVAINIIVIHLLGDAFSPTLIGYISDRSSLQTGMMSMTVAILLASVVLFYGIQFAPKLHENSVPSQPAVHR
jgi:predicted MFS family arabinose efflux permease